MTDHPQRADRGMIRELAPVVVGAVLGSILTGVPALWIAHGQLSTQIQLAREAHHEQARQRRSQAAKAFLSACLEGVLATQQLAEAMSDPARFQIAQAKWQQQNVKELVAFAEVAAEFPGLIELVPDFGVALPVLSPSGTAEARQAVLAKARQLDSSCRGMSTTLLQLLTADLSGKKIPREGTSK